VKENTMAITIYYASGSCPSWRVMFSLALKGLDYETRLLDISKRQHKAAEILAMNPHGKVPVMRDGDFVLYESLAIVSYLDRKYPDPPILGRTAEANGEIWRMWSECVCYVEPIIDRLCIPLYRGVAAEQADAVRAAARDLAAALAPFEARLAKTPWLAGDEPTAADAAFVPMIGHLHRALEKPAAHDLDLELLPIGARVPAFAAWWDRVRAVAGFEKTYPPHWR
jgi:glutathione S-transferase